MANLENLCTTLTNQNLMHEKTEEQIKYVECLLPFRPASSVVPSAMKERRDQNNYLCSSYESVTCGRSH